MKTIGIIGGLTWLSTVEYYKLLNQMVNEQLGGVSSAKIILHSVNFEEIKQLTEAGNWEGITDIICAVARQLEQAGADCLLLGANTMHKIADQVQAAVKIPLLHIAKETAHAIVQKQLSTVALLGTKYVMQEAFYKEQFSKRGITTLIPDQEDIDFINQAIYTEMGKGLFLPATKKRFLQIISSLAAKGAGGIVLGCTEIPILVQQVDCTVPLFDTTRIHATSAIAFALGNEMR